MTLPDWCRSLRDDIYGWWLTLQDYDHPGFFKFCSRGSLYTPSAVTGLRESDIHGTILFLWSLAMITEILGIQDELPLTMPIN